jgi:hypothetical protein
VVGTAGQDADQAEFCDPQAARGDGHDGEQSDDCESSQGGLPGQLGLGQPDGAQACQQDKPQHEVAGHGGGGNPPAAGSE